MGYTVIVDGRRLCIMCKVEKPVEQFSNYKYTTNQGKRKIRYDSRCRECGLIRRRERYVRIKDREDANCKAWREKNREYALAKSKEYRNSAHGKASKAELQRARQKKIKIDKTDKRERLAIKSFYIKAQYMTLETGILHHVDHIIPLSKGGLHHSSNLQVLTALENMRKGDRI